MVVARVKPDGNCVARFILCEDVVELIHVDLVLNSLTPVFWQKCIMTTVVCLPPLLLSL